ncbi:MAG: glycosyltransferase family 39 protein, partial [Chloroflexi bacterium]|nr:glycosyltransferase family 39 protein [Chloroflexota bacterium]
MAVSSRIADTVVTGTAVMARAESRSRPRVGTRQVVIAGGLGLVILLGALLRFYDLGAYSIGNAYYAATVKSMLTSWHNFFFAAYEPGGSVTVDKPPLGFWVQAVSAYFLGVNGFALALPQALAGVLSIPVLFALVWRQFGAWAGLAAALALAVVPVTVATERNNTIDGLLVFVLLLAAGAFWLAARKGRLSPLLLGAALMGLGFNIKMLQAYMVLPAFYAVYLLGARCVWWKRLIHLGLATGVLLAVSLSWVVVVDLTPPESRPYIGSSDDNTVLELVTGHNGLSRLLPGGSLAALTGGDRPQGPPAGAQRPMEPPMPGYNPAQPGYPQDAVRSPAQPGQPTGGEQPVRPPMPAGGSIPGTGPGYPQDAVRNPAPLGPGNQPGVGPAPQPGGGPSQEMGEPGVLRLFSEPLVTQASWLLPLALLGLPLALVVAGRSWPLNDRHLALVLWAGWLLPAMAYLSLSSGIMHTYYLIMLGPPLAALVGASAWALWRVYRRRWWVGWPLVVLLTGTTIAFQFVMLWSYPVHAWWITILAVVAWAAGLGLMLALSRSPRWSKAALALVCLGLMVAPLAWSGLTTLNTHPNVGLPRAEPDTGGGAGLGPNAAGTQLTSSQQVIL